MINNIIKNIPNLITFSRLIFCFLIHIMISNLDIYQNKIFFYYLILIFTDFLDGYMARKLKVNNGTFGQFIDGFIDYIVTSIISFRLYTEAFIDKDIFIYMLIIFIRDTIRNIIRIRNIYYNKKHKSNSASYLGKISRVLQNFLIGFIILYPYNYLNFKMLISLVAMITSVISFFGYIIF